VNVRERATQIWPILVLSANHRQVLTYDQLSKLIGVPRAGLGQLLEPIQSYCLVHQLPPLSVLVVCATSGTPGSGFIAAQDIPRNQAKVFAHPWVERGCPKPEEFADALSKLPSNGIPEAARNAYEQAQ
jgi:hypothetical protein